MTATKIQPVAEICSASHDDAQFGERAIKPLCDISSFDYGTPLYAGAAPAAVAGRTTPRNDDERAAAQFFADNPGAALLAWPLYLARDKSHALEAPAAPVGSARQFIEWMYSQPEDREPTTAEGALLEFEAHLAAAAPQAPAAPSALAAQVIENLLQLARIVNTAVEDWGETKEDDSMEVIFHKEEADKMEAILEFFDGLPDAPAEEGVIESGPLRAARVLRAQAAPAAPAEGEVLVEVIGLTGSGKSAICGEIEILCRALGLDVSWPDGDPEKNMTHAEWTAAIEAYKPRVRIVERNVPRQSNGGPAK